MKSVSYFRHFHESGDDGQQQTIFIHTLESLYWWNLDQMNLNEIPKLYLSHSAADKLKLALSIG